MPQLLWDASALVKQYYDEDGSETVNALFIATPTTPQVTTFMGYAETAAILRRKYNRGDITQAAFASSRTTLENEVLYSMDFHLLSTDDMAVLSGIALSDRHNINSTDAAILAACLDYARSLSPSDPLCIFIAADQRLLRAAGAEGLRTLHPETLPAADVTAYLAALL